MDDVVETERTEGTGNTKQRSDGERTKKKNATAERAEAAEAMGLTVGLSGGSTGGANPRRENRDKSVRSSWNRPLMRLIFVV